MNNAPVSLQSSEATQWDVLQRCSLSPLMGEIGGGYESYCCASTNRLIAARCSSGRIENLIPMRGSFPGASRTTLPIATIVIAACSTGNAKRTVTDSPTSSRSLVEIKSPVSLMSTVLPTHAAACPQQWTWTTSRDRDFPLRSSRLNSSLILLGI